MREVERMNQRLANIGVDVARQRGQPGLDSVYAFALGCESEPVDDPLDRANLVLDRGTIPVGDGDRRRQIAESDMVSAQRLEREVGIDHFVVGIAVNELHGLVVKHLAQHRGDGLALVEPLAPEACERLRRQRLVECNEASDPAIGEILVIECIENAWPAQAWKAEDRQRADMQMAEPWFEPADQWRIGQHAVEIHRRLGDDDRMTAIGNRTM